MKSAIVNTELSISTNVEIGHFNEEVIGRSSSIFGAASHLGDDSDLHGLWEGTATIG
jgi:hypothetical protein